MKACAVTVVGSNPTPRVCRISDMAWYMCVDDTWTEVGLPMTPSRTSAMRAA